jgi:WD40 repeat protein
MGAPPVHPSPEPRRRVEGCAILALALALILSSCVSTRGALGRETILEDRDMVWSIALSPDASKVAVVKLSGPQFVLALHTVDGKRVWQEPIGPSEFDVEGVEFSPDGAWVGTVSRAGGLQLISMDRQTRRTIRHENQAFTALAFHPDGKQVAAGDTDGVVALYDLTGLEGIPFPFPPTHRGPVRALAFADDGTLFSAGASDRTLRISAAGEGGEPHVLPSFINDLAWSGGRLTIALSREQHVRSPELRARELKGAFGEPTASDCAAVFDVVSKTLGPCKPLHRGAVTTAALRPGTSELASGGWDQTVILEGTTKSRKLGWEVRRVRFSKDGRLLAIAAWTPQNARGEKSEPSALLIELNER